MTQDTDRVWANPHDEAPTDDQGRPIHPEKGYPICAYQKTDAEDNNGRKREDFPFCLQSAGWGTDRSTGHCKNHGGAGGAPKGWANGNARHLMYSERMNDDDREAFKRLVDVGDGEHVPIDEFRATLENMIAFEEMRLTRAIDKHPDVDQIAMFECPRCGEKYRRSVDAGDADALVDRCTGQIRIAPKELKPCDYSGPLDKIPGKAWVEFGDKSVERKQSHIARLIQILNQVSEGQTVNVRGDHDVTVEGGDEPVSVDITSVGVDLPDDVDDTDEDGGGDE
jgi:hypothetical protein